MTSAKFTHDDYTVGWVCALPKEQTAALAMLDCEHPALPKPSTDCNAYTLGAVQGHNVVIACLPKGMYGTNSAAIVATRMLDTFPSIKFGLLVGIGAGIPPRVRLGDVVVSTPIKQYPGVVQWDFGETVKGGQFKKIGALNNPPSELLTALSKVESRREMTGSKIPEYLDELASKWPNLVPKYIKSDSLKDPLLSSTGVRDDHVGWHALLITIWRTILSLLKLCLGWQTFPSGDSIDGQPQEKPRDMRIHYGLIASGNRLIKDSVLRDNINGQMDGHVLCVEMEAAGLANEFPCLVIRGICDYADSGKNKDWQEHAAAVAAAFAKELLGHVQVIEVSQMSNAKHIMLEMKNSLDKLSQNVTHIHSAYRTQKHRNILEWLTPIDYSSVHNDTIRRRQSGTCQWLLDSDQYQCWLKTGKQTLFCPGIPGAGKTILTSVVVNDLEHRYHGNGNVGIAYIYCNFRKQDDQRIDKILASLLKQLAERQASFPKVIRDLYNHHDPRRTWPLIEELSEALLSLVKTYDRVYIIFDALDECRISDGTRSHLLKQLADLKDNSDVNLFMTSRYMPDVEEKLQGDILKLEIRASDEDVGSYLDSRLTSLSELVEKNKHLRDDIREKVIKAVDGMFLLAELHVRSLEGMFLPNQIRAALEELPTGTTAYDETYKGAMNRIEARENTKRFAKTVLAWITCARWPLTTSELRHALAVQDGDTDLDETNLPEIGDVVAVCAGLVVVDEESNIIRLAHYTTQQYFERTQGDWFPNAETEITISCLTYLSYKTFQDDLKDIWDAVRKKLQSNRFYDYVATNWGHHARVSKTTSKELTALLLNGRTVEAAVQALTAKCQDEDWIGHYIECRRKRMYNKCLWSRSHCPSVDERMEGLHLAAYFGIAETISALLSQSKDLNVRDPLARTPLTWAAMNGHVDAVQVLLKNGADADARDNAGNSPLYYAIQKGHMTVIEMLLSTSRVDINAENKSYDTPVLKAIQKDDIMIVKKLFGYSKFNVNYRNNDGVTPLFQAVKMDREDVVKLLLTVEEILVDSRDRFGETPLYRAASRGCEAVVELLIDSGKVDVNVKVGSKVTPLMIAAERGREEAVRVLLESGQAQICAQDARGRTALMRAVYHKKEGVVRLLSASRKAGINLPCDKGYTPLSWAALQGYESMVRLLIEIGDADVNTEDGHGRTPLQQAISRWNKPIVWLLLEHGAEFDETIRANMKPLSKSSREDIRIVLSAAMRCLNTVS